MSKSLKRVRAALEAADVPVNIRETALARTAVDAAAALACEVDQIAKSIVLQGAPTGEALLFVTAGGARVDIDQAAELAGEPLIKAEAALVRGQTGFAIGGVSPVGHIGETRKWFDETLLRFDIVWAAAGTPHHVFGLDPHAMVALSGAARADFIEDARRRA